MKELIDIKEYLEKIGFYIDDDNIVANGRVVSGQKEREVLETIKQQFDIEIPDPAKGFWYDFSYKNYFVNIKITDPNTVAADNLNSKEAIYLSLTGKIYEQRHNWETFFRCLGENIKDNKGDGNYIHESP